MSVVEALAREVGAVGKAVHAWRGADWERPTRCPPMTVKDLVAHVARGGSRITEMIGAGTVDAEPQTDAVTYFQYDPAAEASRILQRAQEEAGARTTDELVRYWDEAWGGGLRRARESVDEDPVLHNVFGGLIRLSEYLKTRVVEVAVHHMDLDDAFGQRPHPDREAAEIAGDVLRGLLGTDLRGAGMDDVRFLLTGTGRAQLDEDERAYLGPLASRFPLLA
ncbi:MAG: maleylpyruvate isomerase N-terminal domain-containing protein [Actinobacteria bacterium]|nr:maleylpyruvate isomerase N-terminal domain-containing protein [Actinomycetota bacterium]